MQSKGNFYYKKEKAQISMDLSLTLPFRLVNSKIWISVIWEDFGFHPVNFQPGSRGLTTWKTF